MPATKLMELVTRQWLGVRRSTAVVVMGARSGTSALAGTLGLLGCTLPNRVMPANSANIKGYFEPQDLADLHDELLASFGSIWHDWRPMPPGWHQSLEARKFRARIVEAYRANYGDAALSVLKEPRMCRILPFWDGVFADLKLEPVFIFIDRSPFEVAASLSARDGSSFEQGLLYYIRNHIEAERDTRGRRRAFISYDSLLKDWRTTIQGALREVGIRLHPTTDQVAKINGFLERRLRSQMRHDISPRDELQESAAAVHAAFQALKLTPSNAAACRKLDSIRVAFDRRVSFRSSNRNAKPVDGV